LCQQSSDRKFKKKRSYFNHARRNVRHSRQISTFYLSESKICERFLRFTYISSDGTAGCSLKKTQQAIHEFAGDKELNGQTYDGASVMKGHITALQVFHHIPVNSSYSVMPIPQI
jgi:hypothetical protein